MASRNAENLRRLRQIAVASGKCQVCRCRPRTATSKSCTECLGRTNKHKADHKGIRCTCCGKRLRGKRRGEAFCLACQARKYLRFAAKFQARIDSGLCGRCGQKRQETNRVLCTGCLDYAAARHLTYERSRGVRIKQHSCSTCTALGLPSMNHTHRTHDRYMAKAKQCQEGT